MRLRPILMESSSAPTRRTRKWIASRCISIRSHQFCGSLARTSAYLFPLRRRDSSAKPHHQLWFTDPENNNRTCMHAYTDANGVVHNIEFHLTANSQNLFYYKIPEHFVYNNRQWSPFEMVHFRKSHLHWKFDDRKDLQGQLQADKRTLLSLSNPSQREGRSIV